MTPAENKIFYRRMFDLALPIALQHLMLASVAAADAMMLGRVAQAEMTAVSMATQIQFIQNVFLYAVTTAGAILGAQYYGKGDRETLRDLFHLMLRFGGLVSILFFIACEVFPGALMHIFTSDPELVQIGIHYLRIAGWSYLMTGVSQCYLMIMKVTDHVKECENWEMPKRPVIFNKALNALTAHKAEVAIPVTTSQPDFEAELVVVIGKEGKRLSESQAMDCVAGYCCGNDLTARDWQMGCPGKQWFLGKSFDSFAPTGPWIVTKDEIPDPQALAIRSILNGQVMQDSNTKNFIFSVPRIISHISQGITLKPGDLIFTGSPPGIGYSRNPPVFLCDGDVIEIEIEGIGTMSNRIVRV